MTDGHQDSLPFRRYAARPNHANLHSLGSITRDGTTVHIPFLTTWADYNQRIVVSNRGANPADYWITFRPEEGVTATANEGGHCSVNGTPTRKPSAQTLPPEIERRDRDR